jgi:hypothetical protein
MLNLAVRQMLRLGIAAALIQGTLSGQTTVNLDQLTAPDIASAYALFKDHGDCTPPIVPRYLL